MLKKLLIEKSCYSRSRIKWSRTIKRICEKRREEEGRVCLLRAVSGDTSWSVLPATINGTQRCRTERGCRTAPHRPLTEPWEPTLWFLLYPSHYKCITVSVFFKGDIDMCLLKSRYLLLFYKRIIKTDLTQT